MQSVRVRNNIFETPIYEFDHDTTASRVHFVGMVHVGQQNYYSAVSDYVSGTEAEGSVVHYEMIKRPSPEEAAAYPEVVEQAGLLDGLGVLAEVISKSTNAVKQKEALQYQPHWQNHDISAVELTRLAGPESIQRLSDNIKQLKETESDLDPELFSKLVRGMFRIMPLVIPVNNLFGDKKLRSVVVDHRNDVAVQAVADQIEAEPDRNITMLWGAAHAPGISKGLERLGYNRTSRRWLGALSLTKPS